MHGDAEDNVLVDDENTQEDYQNQMVRTLDIWME